MQHSSHHNRYLYEYHVYTLILTIFIYIYISVNSRATQLPKLGSALILWVAALNI